MAEWLYEAGIGENRAALIEDGRIVEMLIERDDGGPRAGAVVMARLVRRMPNSSRSMLELIDHDCPALGIIPANIAEGARIPVLVVREAIPEAGNPKSPLVRPAEDGARLSVGPTVLDQIQASSDPIGEISAHEADLLESSGWSERLGEAESGLIPFTGGLLRMSLTPAMTVFDVDGSLSPSDLTVAGAAAAASAIRLFDIGGAIGIDLPIAPEGGKAVRNEAAGRIDALLPKPFERTAVNGFGFLQIVRQRVRPSIPELLQSDPVSAAALALLRRAERASGRGAITLEAASVVIQRIAREQGWQDDLARRRGTAIHLSERPGAAISQIDVQAEYP